MVIQWKHIFRNISIEILIEIYFHGINGKTFIKYFRGINEKIFPWNQWKDISKETYFHRIQWKNISHRIQWKYGVDGS